MYPITTHTGFIYKHLELEIPYTIIFSIARGDMATPPWPTYLRTTVTFSHRRKVPVSLLVKQYWSIVDFPCFNVSLVEQGLWTIIQ